MFEDLHAQLKNDGMPAIKLRLQPSRPSNPRLPEGAVSSYLPGINEAYRHLLGTAIAATEPAAAPPPAKT